MKNLILIILIVFLWGCNDSKDNSKDTFNKEFEEKFKEELKELGEVEELGEWKTVEPIGAELQCPCCDYFTLGKRGEYEICPICFWEDDGIDIDDLDEYSAPNHLSLREGRQNFESFGACDSTMVKNVLTESERKKFKLKKRM